MTDGQFLGTATSDEIKSKHFMHKDLLTSLSIIRTILAYKDEDGIKSHAVCVAGRL